MLEILESHRKIWRKLILALIFPGLVLVLLQVFGDGRSFAQTIPEKRYKPELMLQTGSVSLVNAVAISPDGNTIATSGGDGVVRLFDFKSGLQIQEMVHGTTFILSVAFSPDGKTLASGGLDTIIKLWNVKTGKLIKPLEGHTKTIASVAFSPDGKILASGSFDTTARLWNLETGESRELKGHTMAAFSVAFSPTENILATGSTDKTIRLWNTTTGEPIKKLEGHSNEIWCVTFSTDGKNLASSGKDQTVRLWNLETGESKMLTGKFPTIYSMVFLTDNKTLVIGGDTSIDLWNIETGTFVKSLNGSVSYVRSLALSKDTNRLVSGGSDNKVKIWDAGTGQQTVSIEDHTSHILSVAFSPDEKFLAGIGFYNRINLWNLETGKQVKVFEETENPTVAEITTMAFSPDGALLAANDKKNNIKLRNVKDGKILKSFTGHTSQIHSVAFSPDGKMLVSGSEDNTIRLWNVETGQLIKVLTGHEKGVTTVAFSPDGKILASGSRDKTIKLWDIATKTLRKSLINHQDEVSSVKFSTDDDGKTLYSASFDKTIKLWDSVTGQNKSTLTGHPDMITSVSPSIDGKTLVSGDRSGNLLQWDLKTGDYKLIKAHSREISAVSFAPQKNVFVSSSWDGTMKLWRTDRDEPAATLFSLDKSDWAVIAPTSHYDVSANAEKLMYFIVSDPDFGQEIIDLDQLKQYYTPNLLKKLFVGNLNIKEKQLSVVLYPKIEVEQSNQKANTLELKLTNRGGGIGHVEVRINDSELENDASDGKYIDTRNPVVNLSITILVEKLQPGINKGEIIVWNGEGNVRSQPHGFSLEKNDSGIILRGIEPVKLAKDERKVFDGKFYAIVAGISEYADSKYNLRYAAKDAEDIMQTLTLGARKMLCSKEIEEKKPCERLHLRLLTTEKDPQAQFIPPDDIKQNFQRFEPTKQNFEKVFKEIAKTARPEDVVIIYLAGHGIQMTLPDSKTESGFSDTYLYPTSDADTFKEWENKSNREAMTVSSLELADWVNEFKDGIAAKKKAIILDTCAAGAVREDLKKPRSDEDNDEQIRALVRLNERTGFYVLMGSASDAVSYEASDFRQGLLTYALIQTIANGDGLDGKGLLDIEKWFLVVGNEVEDLAEDLGGIQSPISFKDDSGKTAARSFPIGMFKDLGNEKLPLALSVPAILQPEFWENKKFTDEKLHLRDKLEKRLFELSRTLKRDDPTAFNYVSAKTYPKGWNLRGEYVILNGLVTVNGALSRDGDKPIPFKLTGTEDEIVEKVIAEIRRIVKVIKPKQ